MKIAISSGHGKYIRGASGPPPIPPYCDEVDEVRKIVEAVATELHRLKPPVDVVTFHDNTSRDQSTNLSTITSWHNKQTRDLDVSIHLNAYDGKAHGVEVLYVTQQDLAAKVSAAIAKLGFTDRGAKKRTDLAFLNNTNKPAVLIENHFCDNKADCELYRKKFNLVASAIAESLSGQQAQPGPTPPAKPELPEPPAEAGHPMLKKGDRGEAVAGLQRSLGVLNDDGDFGAITDRWVRGFQAACGLSADGIVGDKTWAHVDALDTRVKNGAQPLPLELAKQIYTAAQTSELADYAWKDRGVPPPGYIAGMCLSFAYVHQLSKMPPDEDIEVMGKPLGASDYDALAWYKDELVSKGLTLATFEDRLRSLFVLMIGLGPRESSGRYCEGKDASAENVQSETCEAGLFQTSWNIKAGSSTIEPLLDEFWENPLGFLEVWKEGISPTENNLSCFGTGDGAMYQWLSRFCPLFHVMVTAVGLRTQRKHWGPINEKKAEIKKEADQLLREVAQLVDPVA